MASQHFGRVAAPRRGSRGPARRHAAVVRADQGGGADLRPPDPEQLAEGARPGLVLPRQDPLPARLPARGGERAGAGRGPPARGPAGGADPAPGQPADGARRLHRRGRGAERHVAQGDELALRPLQPGHRPAQARRHAAQHRPRHGDPRRRRPQPGGERGVPLPARPGQRRPRLHRPRRGRSEGGARLPRAGAAEEPAVEQGAARLRLGGRFAQGAAARARALDRARRPRRRRLGRARGPHRRALRLRQARRLRPGARPLQRRHRRLRPGVEGAARIDRRPALAEVDRRP